MSVYDPLRARLNSNSATSLKLTFIQIEELIGRPLPRSAYDYDAWWSNEDPVTTQHTQNRAWRLAGFSAEPNRAERAVTFRRTAV
jgi:hypothetical protein